MSHRPLWAALRETAGENLPTREPRAALLAAHPELRGLRVDVLARELGIAREDAERMVETFLAESVPTELIPHDARGLSLDERIVRVGRPSAPIYLDKKRAVRTGDAGAIGDVYTYTSAPLPLGFFYRMPSRATFDFAAQPYPVAVAVEPPTAYDARCATILRSDIPQDPQDGTLPHPDWLRAFCFAMGIGTGTAPDGGFWFQVGGLPQSALTASARGVVEDVGTWPAPQPGESFPLDDIRRAFAAFRWYGPLSGDVETRDGVRSWEWGAADQVSRERYVFWYQRDDEGVWNKCCQIQGFSHSTNAWALPVKWGQHVRSWVWRPTESQFVGEWRTFFSWDRWTAENKSSIAIVAVWVASIAVTVATLGAGAATLAAAAAFTAVAQAGMRLYQAIGNGDPSAAVAACVEIGRAVNGVSDDGSFMGAMAKNNPGLARFAASVAAPFQKIYSAAGEAAGSIEAVWAQAEALRSQLPAVNASTWASAFQAFGVNTGAISGASTWLQMARLPSSSGVAAELWANAPPWARNMVTLGAGLSACEQAQSFKGGGVAQLLPTASRLGGGGMMMRAPQAVQAVQVVPSGGVRARWSAVPPPPKEPAVPVLNASEGPPSSAAGTPLVLGAAVLLGLFFLKR